MGTAAFLAGLPSPFEGGLRANDRIPAADLLSTFTGGWTLDQLDASGRPDWEQVRVTPRNASGPLRLSRRVVGRSDRRRIHLLRSRHAALAALMLSDCWRGVPPVPVPDGRVPERPAVTRLDECLERIPDEDRTAARVARCEFALDRGDARGDGPVRSGKSTLLHMLGTLDRPAAGNITLEGTDPFALSERELAAFRNRSIGFVFQDHHLLPQCSVLENVLVPTLVSRETKPAETEAYARQLLERVGLAGRLDHRPAELSGGERQRGAVARALVLKPVLLLADEPTGNLDRKNAQAIGDLLLDLHRQENNILVVVPHTADSGKLFRALRSQRRHPSR